MLEPDSRHLLTDALRPPDGYAVDVALATTYTLDLTSLLLAPLAMAAYDQSSETDVNSLAMLESLRRYADRTTVFCQAGGIHVPAAYQRLAAFAEGCVVEVSPPANGRVFHPKLWALRFISPDGPARHRLVCLSRNLTGDRSWDTVLVCDENPSAERGVDPAPLAAFIEHVVTLAVRALDERRRAQLSDLATTLRSSRLEVPAPFTAARLLPLGVPSGGSWPLPQRVDRLVVISPFLDAGAVARLPHTPDATVVSREQTFDRLGAGAFGNQTATMVLQPIADGPFPDEHDEQHAGPREIRTGLHAKVLAWDEGQTGHLVTGSANCTTAAFDGNVEFAVHLSGPLRSCGASALLSDSKDQPGLVRLLQPYAIANVEPPEDPALALEMEIEAFHAAVANQLPQLHVSPTDSGYDVTLKMTLPEPTIGESTVRPISLKRQVGSRLLSVPLPSWSNVSLLNLTPFLVVETTLSRGGTAVTRDCVIATELLGAPADRSTQILKELLASEEDILRYLALLLADPSLDAMMQRLLDAGQRDADPDRRGGTSGPWFADLVLLEPLVRASARGDASLQRVQGLLEELRDKNGNLPAVSAEFEALWQVVWAAREPA